MVEIAGIRVMRRMSAQPETVWREGHDADCPAYPVVRRASPEACAVAAIVLNHEEAHEKAGGRKREQQTQPIADAQCRPHQRPKHRERHSGDQKFEDAAR